MKLPHLLALLTLCSASVAVLRAEPLKVGDSAPIVTATTESGASVNLGDVYKKQPYTLVYFYPRAGTSGCTAQGCSLRDAYEKLTQKGVAVVGVSTDDTAAQEKFKTAQHFPFTLVADPDKKVINAFGVPIRKGKDASEMATRQAYLIKDGKIIWADYKAATDKQADDVLKVLDEQKG
jgi:thioredoxin-dependent peroxiredoxin